MIEELLENDRIEIFLQPIVSIKDKSIFAFEALTRAYDEKGNCISPTLLFETAYRDAKSCKLDEYVRELALQNFLQYYHQNSAALLFLNYESSVIDSRKHTDFIDVVKKYDIPSSNIVIEIKEDKVKDNELLKDFIELYKQNGFVIAIDDFGTGYSSFDRLELIKPDIVKVDRSIISDIHDNFINSEILSAISNMCHQIGSIVLAEGVEDSDEILTCMKKDIDIYQGYWFAKPAAQINENDLDNIQSSIQEAASIYKKMIQSDILKKQLVFDRSKSLTSKTFSILQEYGLNGLDEIEKVFLLDDALEAIYFIHFDNGIQVGKTFINAKDRYLYKPTSEGYDHSLREYYFITKDSSRGDYLSKRYVSKASGNMCRTYASKIRFNRQYYIVCFDIAD